MVKRSPIGAYIPFYFSYLAENLLLFSFMQSPKGVVRETWFKRMMEQCVGIDNECKSTNYHKDYGSR